MLVVFFALIVLIFNPDLLSGNMEAFEMRRVISVSVFIVFLTLVVVPRASCSSWKGLWFPGELNSEWTYEGPEGLNTVKLIGVDASFECRLEESRPFINKLCNLSEGIGPFGSFDVVHSGGIVTTHDEGAQSAADAFAKSYVQERLGTMEGFLNLGDGANWEIIPRSKDEIFSHKWEVARYKIKTAAGIFYLAYFGEIDAETKIVRFFSELEDPTGNQTIEVQSTWRFCPGIGPTRIENNFTGQSVALQSYKIINDGQVRTGNYGVNPGSGKTAITWGAVKK